ncbi:MAG: allantoinase AllB [Beijerinckiaceae bacterium]
MTSPFDLAILNGTVVTHEGRYPADIGVRGETIAAITSPGTLGPARETLDAAGLHILPGAIDVHVHFRDPGMAHKEDWDTGTAAAAMGGVTTVFEMPNTFPPTGTPEMLADKFARAKTARIDFGLYGLLAEDNIQHLEALITGGAAAFKCFMGNTTGNLPSPSTGAMLEGFEIIAKHGHRIALHAETASIMAWRQARLMAAGRSAPLDHLAARPAVVAVEAVSRAAVLAEWTGARIHVLHISSADELRPLREAQARGVDVTGETCPCYLMLDSDDYARLGPIIKVNPPVREPHHKAELWRALIDGTIGCIATDHAPHTPEEKRNLDIWEAAAGFPGVETQMPLMLTTVNEGRLSLEHYVRISAFNPANTFGLLAAKGRIAVGAHADLAIIDLSAEDVIDEARLHSVRARVTPFHGVRVKGLPIHTLSRGRFVMKARKLVEEARGTGRSVHAVQRMPAPAPRRIDESLAAVLAG